MEGHLMRVLEGATRRLVELSCERRIVELAEAAKVGKGAEAKELECERSRKDPRGYRRPTSSR
jgi:hypothetical protein